jgi:aminoglycoside phosphotransferase (APT) family kinase protein
MNDALAKLHAIDIDAAGLSDFGKPGNYFARQWQRWSEQYRASETYEIADMNAVIGWLGDHMPPDDGRVALVHGDYRIDNMIFDASSPRLIAVLDWELSTLGHPLVDFCFHAMMYRVPVNLISGLCGVDLEASNIPTEQEYVDLYCRNTHRERIPHYEYYLAFNMFRLAAILHGIKARALRGTASSPHALEASRRLEELATLASEQARRAACG